MTKHIIGIIPNVNYDNRECTTQYTIINQMKLLFRYTYIRGYITDIKSHFEQYNLIQNQSFHCSKQLYFVICS